MSAEILIARERCVDIINRFPAWQLSSLADSLEAMLKTFDEIYDEAFCIALAERSKASEDYDEPGVSIESFAAELGIVLGEDDED